MDVLSVLVDTIVSPSKSPIVFLVSIDIGLSSIQVLSGIISLGVFLKILFFGFQRFE